MRRLNRDLTNSRKRGALRKQFNFNNTNCVAASIEVPCNFYGLILILLYVALLLQFVSRVTRHLQDILSTILHDLSGEGLSDRSLLRWSLRVCRLLSLLVGLRYGRVPRR